MDIASASVLVVDPEDSARSTAAGMLAELGLHDVTTAQNGQAALGHLEQRPFEVLLSELRLEPKSGFELFEAAKSRAPRISGLLMSASATARDVETSRDLGIVEVVSRPFTTERLATALGRAVAAARGLWGEVQQLTLLDMLQMYHYGRRSMVVHLTGEAVGRIFVRGGEIVHATADELRGLTALCRLLQATSGVLRIEALPSPTERTIRQPFAALLLEALHRLDEEAIRRPSESPRLPEELGSGFETAFGELDEGDRDLAPERLQASLRRLSTLDGYLGSCLADTQRGKVLATHGEHCPFDPDSPETDGSAAVRARLTALRALGLDDGVEDILITLGHQHQLIRPLVGRDDLCLFLALRKTRSNLGLGRYRLAAAAAEFAR